MAVETAAYAVTHTPDQHGALRRPGCAMQHALCLLQLQDSDGQVPNIAANSADFPCLCVTVIVKMKLAYNGSIRKAVPAK